MRVIRPLVLAGLLAWAWSSSQTAGVAANAPATGKWINLLKLVDVKRDTIKHISPYGAWEMDKNGLSTLPNGNCWIEVGYMPPEEYDFRYSFVRHSGQTEVVVLLPRGKEQFGLNWKKDWLGIDKVNNNKEMEKNGGAVAMKLVNEQRYGVLVEVRKETIRIVVNGKEAMNLKTEGLKLGATLPGPDAACIYLGARQPTTFQSVEVREVTGEGKMKHEKGK